jgi:hypothetical protein
MLEMAHITLSFIPAVPLGGLQMNQLKRQQVNFVQFSPDPIL